MKAKRSERKSVKLSILTAVAVIGASTLLFQGFTQAAVNAEFKKTETVPTSYANYFAGSPQAAPNSLPEGYAKANYTVKDHHLEYYQNQTPTSKDMTKEEAAEFGAQGLWSIFDLSLEGQVVEIGYQPANENMPRSSWYADVWVDGKRSYYFSVDSVTGELFSIGHSRKLDKKVSVEFDMALHKNPQEYVKLAKELAEKYNVVHSAVKSVEYNGQGYSENDPTISVDITGENGEIALMTFSRHDKALLGIGYNTLYKASLESAEKHHKEALKKFEELEKSGKLADKKDGSFLIPLE